MLQHSGEMVKAALRERDMTQVELARRIGMDQSLISRYLSGRIEVSDKAARHIAEALEIDFEQLRDQLERDRLERKVGRLRVQYKDVIGEEETDSAGKRTDVGAAILVDSPGVVAIPLLDSIPTGKHIQPGEEVGRYALPPDVHVDAERAFALRVSGDSMTDDKVDEGDIIVVDPVAEVRGDGDRVVVMLRDGPALGRIYRKGNTIVLQLPGDRKEPVIFLLQENNFQLVGRVELCVKRFV